MNNFKKLQEMEVAEAKFESDYVKSGITGSMNTFRFIGDMLDHFIPKVLGMFINFAGGDTNDTNPRRPKYPNTSN